MKAVLPPALLSVRCQIFMFEETIFTSEVFITSYL